MLRAKGGVAVKLALLSRTGGITHEHVKSRGTRHFTSGLQPFIEPHRGFYVGKEYERTNLNDTQSLLDSYRSNQQRKTISHTLARNPNTHTSSSFPHKAERKLKIFRTQGRIYIQAKPHVKEMQEKGGTKNSAVKNATTEEADIPFFVNPSKMKQQSLACFRV